MDLNSGLHKSTNSEIIKRDLIKLENQNEKNNFFEILKEMQTNQDFGGDKYNIKETKIILEVDNLYQQNRYDEVIKRASFEIEQTANKYLKITLYKKCFNAYKKLEKIHEAFQIIDKIITIDPKNSKHFIIKASLENEHQKKLAILDEALIIDEFNETILNKKISLLIDKYNSEGAEQASDLNKIMKLLDRSIEMNPSISNEAWKIKFHFLKDINEPESKILEIINKLEKQKPNSIDFLELKYETLKNDSEKESFITEIEKIKDKVADDMSLAYELLILKIMSDIIGIDDNQKIFNKLEVLSANSMYNKNALFIKTKANLFVSKFNKVEEAILLLKDLVKKENNASDIKQLIKFQLLIPHVDEARNFLNESIPILNQKDILEIEKDINEEEKNNSRAIEIVDKLLKMSLSETEKNNYLGHKAYLFLQSGNYQESKNILTQLLEKENYNIKLEAYIINYELSNKLLSKNISKTRLDKIMRNTKSELTKAAVCMLNDNSSKAIEHIQHALKKDYFDRYLIKDWPIFTKLHGIKKYEELMC